MHMMLRIVNIAEFTQGTTENPQGVYWEELPEGWDTMSQQDQDAYRAQRAAQYVDPNAGRVAEVVDADNPDYVYERAALA